MTSETPQEIRKALPKALLLGDLVLFNCTSYLNSPALAFFPISDEHKSPVLGMIATVGSDGIASPPRPVEVAYLAAALKDRASKASTPEHMLGVDLGTWEKSEFTRTSEPFKNAKRENCHIVAGFIHVQIPRGDTLLWELRQLLEQGRIVFSPFIRTGNESEDLSNDIMKAGLVNASPLINKGTLRTSSGLLHPLDGLEIPYLEKVPLELLCRILSDEEDSLRSFRRALDRVIEDIEGLPDPEASQETFRKLKRSLLEDELEKVRSVCERVKRMNSVARIGGYIGTMGLSIGTVLGATPASIVTGAAGIASATFAHMYKNYEDRREIRKSPMHFVWSLESLQR